MRVRVAAALAVAAALGGCAARCGGGDGTTRAKRSGLVAMPDVDATRLSNADAGEDAPLVVAIHGRGDTPESFSDTFHAYEGRATFVFFRGTAPYGEGSAWFSLGAATGGDELAAGVASARDALHARITKVARGRRYAMVGFSQGGFLAFAFAARYPAEVACALPIAGMLPPSLYPVRDAPTAEVFAFHGEDDPRVAASAGRATANAFVAAGGSARFTAYPGLGHTTHAAERADLYRALDRCLETLTKSAPRALPSAP